MKEVTLVLKSGAKARFTAEQFKTIINGFGAIEKIEWDTKGLRKQLVHLNKHNIDAIFVEDISEKELIIQSKISMVVKLSGMISILCLDSMLYLKRI